VNFFLVTEESQDFRFEHLDISIAPPFVFSLSFSFEKFSSMAANGTESGTDPSLSDMTSKD
jgi:hypothetical protein